MPFSQDSDFWSQWEVMVEGDLASFHKWGVAASEVDAGPQSALLPAHPGTRLPPC